MAKLPVVKTREFIKALNHLGFFELHRLGSHAQFRHIDGRRTTVPIHAGKDIRKGTLKAILRDLNVSVEALIAALKK